MEQLIHTGCFGCGGAALVIRGYVKLTPRTWRDIVVSRRARTRWLFYTILFTTIRLVAEEDELSRMAFNLLPSRWQLAIW